jgi:hypothetical protein
MKLLASLGRWSALTATVAMVGAPSAALGDGPPAPTAAVQGAPSMYIADVALDEAGGLNGQAVTTQGQPLVNQTVVLDNGLTRAAATTNEQGQFRFDNVRGGAYRVQLADHTQYCRAWRAGTAPPIANGGLMVVQGDQSVLGQYCGTPVGCGSPVGAGFAGFREALHNPLVVGGIIAAAIAIPVALHNSDDDDPAPAS